MSQKRGITHHCCKNPGSPSMGTHYYFLKPGGELAVLGFKDEEHVAVKQRQE
jgi:hypothetical protein